MKKHGLRWTDADCFIGNVRPHRFEQIARYCRANRLNYSVNNTFGERSKTYREAFFHANPPLFRSVYLCAYCGLPYPRRKITVDHLYPVAYAKKSVKYQKRARRRGMESINDLRNLVAACSRCNSKKSAKMGIWIIRGKIGRHQHLWIFRHIVRIAVISFLIWYFATNGFLPLYNAIADVVHTFANQIF